MARRIAVVGGGPGGLFFATQLRALDPATEVVVFERNGASDAFGFGVVFSDSTLAQINAADPVLRDALAADGTHWQRIEVWAKGRRLGFDGNGMAAIHRRALLPLLHERARQAGVEMRFGSAVADLEELAGFDVIVGADGANSRIREAIIDGLGHHVETASAKFIWFGTRHLFDGLTFVHRKSDHGHFAAHAYPIGSDISTFIVETDERTWQAAGLDAFDATQPPGPSDERTREYLARLFHDDIQGAEIVANNSRWASFRTRSTERWHSGNVVLLGDAVHTAHFSVGSGTKMAMEDGIVLARELAAGHASREDAFAAYEAERKPKVARIQAAARGGLGWWERFGVYHDAFEPTQFAFHFFSRSIDIDRIEPRDQAMVYEVRENWRKVHGADALATPLTIGGHRLPGRIVTRQPEALVAEDGTTVPVPGNDVVAVDAAAATDDGALSGVSAAVVHGADMLTRLQRSEDLRLLRGIVTIIDAHIDELDPETVVLAGRADAVAIHD